MGGAKTASTSITRGSAATLRPIGIVRAPAWRGQSQARPRRPAAAQKGVGQEQDGGPAESAELYDELDDGVVTNASYTVAYAIEEWLADGLAGRAPKAVSTQREVLEPLIDIIGAVPLGASSLRLPSGRR